MPARGGIAEGREDFGTILGGILGVRCGDAIGGMSGMGAAGENLGTVFGGILVVRSGDVCAIRGMSGMAAVSP